MKTVFYSVCVLLFLIASQSSFSQEKTDSVKYHYPVVTSIGTRYAEPWVQVPLALTLIQQKDMPKGKGYGLDEVLAGVPGVLVQSRFGNQDVRITIRGYGARGAGERSNAGTSRGVRILSNGFPDTEPDGRTSFDLTDISGAGAIEIMRSNASSVYGNASGGVINIMSNTNFAAPFVSYAQSFGSFGFRKEMIHAGANLSSGKMYLSLSNTNSDGWRQQSRSSQVLLNTGIVASLGDRTTLGVHIAATSNIFRIPGPLSLHQYDSLAQQSDSLYRARDERRYNRLGRLGLNITHELNDDNMISASAFVQPKVIHRSERNTYRDFNRYHVGGNAMFKNQMTFNEDMQNTFLVGMDEAYQDGAILFYSLTRETGRGTLSDNKREGANNFGAFVQDEFSVNNFLFLVGLRYDKITYYSDGYFAAPAARKRETKEFSQATPKFGITYRFSPTHSVYANYGGGIEVPAGNETDPSGTVPGDSVYAINPLLEPIRSKTIEVGTKQIISLGGEDPFAHLTYDVAAYWLQVTDDIIPYRNGRFYFTAGKTERMGLEVAGNIDFRMGFSANVAVTASSNKYKTYIVDSLHYGKPGRFADYSNNKVVGIPNLYFNVGVKYASELLCGAYVRANLQNVGKYFADDANKIQVPAYTIFNASVGIDHLNLGPTGLYFHGFLGVNNIADSKYIGSAWLNPDYPAHLGGKQAVYIEPGLPRNVAGSFGIGMDI